jgi:hypothetical protein
LSPVRRVSFVLLIGAALHAGVPEGAGAQVPSRDTLRTRRDSLRADSIRVRGDTLRRPDSISVAVPLPPDSARADSARARQRADSIRAARLAREAADTIKAPIATAEVPPDVEIASRYRWNRDQLFSSGALTLGELLGRVPGVTAYLSGWIATPHTNTYLGDFGRVRVFYDGVEIDPLDVSMGRRRPCPEERECSPGAGAMLDLSSIPIWTVEELVVERAAEELRVHLRSWRVDRTTPYSRVDVSTGDLSTNSYRGFFGRRFRNGAALQLGAQQYSTQDPRAGGDGDLLDVVGRLGWAKKEWSVDAVALRTRRTRTDQLSCSGVENGNCAIVFPELGEGVAFTNIPGLEATRSDAYVRVSYGSPERARWLQVIAATSRFAETNEKTTPAGGSPDQPFTGDTVDTTASRAQYVVTGGTRLAGTSVSGTARLRVFNGAWYLSPSGRVGFQRGPLALSAFAEHQVDDSTLRVDVSARVSPFRRASFAASVGRSSPTRTTDRPTSLAYRGEAGLRLGRLWVTGGMMAIDTAHVPAPVVYDTTYLPFAAGRRTGTFATLRGPIWKAVSLDVSATKWTANQPYLPEYQIRSELYIDTSWLGRFPQRNFHILASVSHEYRSSVLFPRQTATAADFSSQYQVISTLLELRLYDASISWQYRNVTGEIYAVIPGFQMPRLTNYYGVRWNFFN